MSKPRLLDLFCKAGGSSMGYSRAGFDVTGVDIEAQPHYPFRFIQADALEYVAAHGHEYDVIAASPPCQEYSPTRFLRNANAFKRGYKPKIRPKLLEATREVLTATGKPWVIENVKGAPMPAAYELCGSMFCLPIRRHRWFETSFALWLPKPCQHTKGFYNVIAGRTRGYGEFASTTRVYVDAKGSRRKGEGFPGKAVGQKAFGIDWMTVDEMSEAVPPAYTQFIGEQLLAHLAAL